MKVSLAIWQSILIAVTAMLAAGSLPIAALPVELIVDNTNTVDWNGLPVTSGVPFLRGTISNVSQLALLDEADQPVPVQFLPIVEFNDGTPRWVLVDFQPTVAAGQSRTYRIVAGSAAAHPTPLTIDETASAITVDTGAAVFVIS
ncbi:MAG: hypothetical protein ACE5K7_03650, partial [Phycisphaerae bacterium]